MRPLNNAERGFLTLGRSAKNQDGLRERAGNNDFVVNFIVSQTMHRPADAGRSLVALVHFMKNENRVSDVVGDVQIAGSRIERNRVRPIQLSLFTLNDAQRFDVAVRVERIDRNRGKFETAGPCNKVVADGTPVGDEDELSVY